MGKLSMCEHCYCMTKTIRNKCAKCKKRKKTIKARKIWKIKPITHIKVSNKIYKRPKAKIKVLKQIRREK